MMDPACGISVDRRASETAEYRGERYFFCSAECRAAFVRNPSGHLRHPPMRAGDRGEPAEPERRRDPAHCSIAI